MNRLRPYLIGCFAALALAGCASDAAGAAVPTTAPATTIASAPAADATPPTDVPATVAPTVATTGQLETDFAAALVAREHCTDDPATCDYAAIAVPASAMDVELHSFVAVRLQLKLRTKPGVGEVTTKVETASVTGDTASLTACSSDTATVFDIADPANPADDVVFDDSQYSTRTQYALNRISGKWLIASATELERSPGEALCVS